MYNSCALNAILPVFDINVVHLLVSATSLDPFMEESLRQFNNCDLNALDISASLRLDDRHESIDHAALFHSSKFADYNHLFFAYRRLQSTI